MRCSRLYQSALRNLIANRSVSARFCREICPIRIDRSVCHVYFDRVFIVLHWIGRCESGVGDGMHQLLIRLDGAFMRSSGSFIVFIAETISSRIGFIIIIGVTNLNYLDCLCIYLY